MGKDAYYFSHDSNAIIDPKILDMRADYQLEGYGLYWVIVEMLRNQIDYKLPLNKSTYRAIKTLSNASVDIEQYIQDCINEYDLFCIDGDSFYSQSLLRRMTTWDDIKDKRSIAGSKGAAVRVAKMKQKQEKPSTSQANVKQLLEFANQNDENAQAKSSKGKERKGKEKKGEESKGEDIPDPYSDCQKEMASRLVITWESNGYGSLNPITVDKLLADAEIYSEQWVHDAIVRGNERGKRNYAYMKAILNSWQTSGRDSPKPQQKQQDSSKVLGFTEREYDMSMLEKQLLGRD